MGVKLPSASGDKIDLVMEDFVPYKLAVKLKEKGFPQVEKNTLAMYDEDGCISYLCPTLDINKCYYIFDDFDEDDCVCPTISQVLKWLRKEKQIDAGATWDNSESKWIAYASEMDKPDLVGLYTMHTYYNSWEEASLAIVEFILDNLI